MARKTEKPLAPHTAALIDLGFTETEAGLYSELLRHGPASGYRLAGAIGKAAPNVYQALETLFAKGAVMATEGRTRVFRATPVEEFLAALETDFRGRRSAAQAALGQLSEAQSDDRFYQLKTVAQIFERARIMIEGAQEIVLHDLFPEPYGQLCESLEAASARGLRVAGIDYAKDASKPARRSTSGIPWRRWPGQQITLVADASETLFALISADGGTVLRGLWTNSAYVSCLNHSGLASQIHVAGQHLPGRLPEPIASIGLLAANPPGLRALLGEVSGAEPS